MMETYTYNVKSPIHKSSTGRFSAVYKGTFGESSVAIKVLNGVPACGIGRKHESSLQELSTPFLYPSISHDNLINYFGVKTNANGREYVILEEFMALGPLNEYLEKHCIDWEQKKNIVANLLSAVIYLWENTCGCPHTYIKAENVYLDKNYRAKLSHVGRYSCKESFNSFMPDPFRLPTHDAPESFLSNPPSLDEKTDVWSFGMMMYEVCMDGKMPFHGDITNQDMNTISLYNLGCAVKSIGDKLSNKIIPFQRTEFINGDVGFVHTMYQCLEFDRLERNKFKDIKEIFDNYIHPIQANYTRFEDDLDPDRVGSLLHEWNVNLDPEHLSELTHRKEKVAYLLEKIQRGGEGARQKFKDALVETNQSWLAELL